jgi:hypothetical protein
MSDDPDENDRGEKALGPFVTCNDVASHLEIRTLLSRRPHIKLDSGSGYSRWPAIEVTISSHP